MQPQTFQRPALPFKDLVLHQAWNSKLTTEFRPRDNLSSLARHKEECTRISWRKSDFVTVRRQARFVCCSSECAYCHQLSCSECNPQTQCCSQVKSQTLEVKFAEVTAELQELRDRQKPLEARNALLEKLMQLNKQSLQPPAPLSSHSDQACVFIVQQNTL